jgi:hypothetical protein
MLRILIALILLGCTASAAEPLLNYSFDKDSPYANSGTLGQAGDLLPTGTVQPPGVDGLELGADATATLDAALDKSLSTFSVALEFRLHKQSGKSRGILAGDKTASKTTWSIFVNGKTLIVPSRPVRRFPVKTGEWMTLLMIKTPEKATVWVNDTGKELATWKKRDLNVMHLGSVGEEGKACKMTVRSLRVWDQAIDPADIVGKAAAESVVPADNSDATTAAVAKPAPSPPPAKKSGPSRWYDSGMEAEKGQNYERALRLYDLAISDGDDRARDRKDGLMEMYTDVLSDCKAAVKAGKTKSATRRLDFLIKQFGDKQAAEAVALRKTIK